MVVMGAWEVPGTVVVEAAPIVGGAPGEPGMAPVAGGDGKPAAKPVRAGLFVVQDGLVQGGAQTEVDAGGAVRLSAVAPWSRWGVVSMEAWEPATRLAWRQRLAMGFREVPPDLFTLSDLMLLESGAEPGDLEDLVGVLRTSTEAAGDEALGLAFEVYGLRSPAERVGFKAWVEKRDPGLFARFARWLGLGSREEVTVGWRESGPDRPGPLFRTFSIRLPELEPGTYEVVIEVSAWGRSPLQTRRGFTVP